MCCVIYAPLKGIGMNKHEKYDDEMEHEREQQQGVEWLEQKQETWLQTRLIVRE